MFSGHSRLVRDEIAERGANDADEGAVVVVAGWMDGYGGMGDWMYGGVAGRRKQWAL